MADYGLLVKNTNGQVQIDSLYRNFSFWESGTLDISEGYNTIDFTDTSQVPIVAIRPSSTTYCALARLNKSSGNYASASVEGEIGESGTIGWAVFVEGTLNPLPSYGLVVRNPSGDVVFSSNERYFKIIDVYSLNVSEGGYVDVSVQDADNNYFVLYPYSYYIESELAESPEEDVWISDVYILGMKKMSSTIVRVGTFLGFSDITGGDETSSLWFSDCKLIEVSF